MQVVAAICLAPASAVQTLHVHLPYADDELMVVMTALRSIKAHTTHLQFLGLYGLPCRSEQLPVLHQLLSECPGILDQLMLDTHTGLRLHEKTSFFAAVAQVHDLKDLHMPKWVGFISDASHLEACDPLRSIPGLMIFVLKSHSEGAGCRNRFPPDLEFHGS